MNFQGRWYTINETCVAVHEGSDIPEAKWWGHEIRLQAPYFDNRKFYWDFGGNCVYIIGTVDDTTKYHLKERVNPQGYSARIECVDCEECRKERKEGRNY